MRRTAPNSASADAQNLTGQVLGEKYRIDGVIGRGGMGVVYRGLDLDLKRNVAIKILHAAFSRNEIITRRFEREARSAAGLSHPNIVSVHDSGETSEGLRYLVMELLEGQELKALLGEPMPPHLALERAFQILSGLAYAHSHGIVHRDLKPENVFVTTDHEGNEVIKLVDFGVAKIVDPAAATDGTSGSETSQPNREDTVALTQAGLIFGTPTYMSPEQATGTPVDARSDLYSFGVILFEMLSGQPPLYHKDPIRLIRMQVSVAPPPLADSFSDDLRGFVHTLLAKERADRFDQSEEALEVLRTLLAQTSKDMLPGPALTKKSRDQWIKNTQAGRDVLSQRDTYPGSGKVGRVKRSRWQRRLRLGWALGRRWCIQYPIRAAGLAAAGTGLLVGLFVGVDGLLKANANGDSHFLSTKEVSGPAPSTSEIADIDRALLAKDYPAARSRLDPLLKLYPGNGQLLWREAKLRVAALASKKKPPNRRILEHYGAAIQADSKLLDDPEFYREIYDLLTHSAIRVKDAIDTAINVMGEHGHPYLLSLINKPVKNDRSEKSAMPYDQRHRIINALKTKETSNSRIDHNIQLHRDLVQAQRQHDPCGLFLATLDAIAEVQNRDYFLDPLHEARPPRPNPKNTDTTQQARCDAAKIRLTVLREQLEETYGKGVLEKPLVSAGAAANSPAPSPKPKSGKSSKTDKRSSTSRGKSTKSNKGSRKRRPRRQRKPHPAKTNR